MSLGVREQPATGLVDGRPEPDAREHVEQRAILRDGMPHVVRRDDRHAMRVGQIGEPPCRPRTGAVAMMVHVDGEAIREDAAQPVEPRRRGRRIDEWAVVAAGETEETRGMLLDLVPRDAPLAFLAAERARGQEPAEIRVPGAALDQHVQRTHALDDDVRAHDRAHAGLLRRLEEARRTGEPVAVRERDRVVPERRGARDEVLGQRRAVEEGERAPTAQLDVVSHRHRPRTTRPTGDRGSSGRCRRR
jgi:hypothetical protein